MERIFIIILNWNGWQDTYACLDSLDGIALPVQMELCVVVVDNGSENHSVDRLKDYIAKRPARNIKLIENKENLGFAAGNNVGIKYAIEQKADWILLLNNDTTVEKDFLVKLLEIAKDDKNIGLVNPKILAGDYPSNKIWFVGGKINPLNMRGEHIAYQQTDVGQFNKEKYFTTDYASGCCVLFRADFIKRIGFMSEDYFLYYEDTEWCFKARKKGLQCAVVPGASVWHKGAASSKEGSVDYIRYHVRNGLIFIFRNGNIFQILFAYFFLLPRTLWQLPKLLSIEKEHWAKGVLWGITDFLNGKTGKIKN